jgi:methylenetetrahydrofolate reductase (NADPH)
MERDMLAETTATPAIDERRRMAELVISGSLEMLARDARLAPAIAAALPTGTAVYVPSIPKQPLSDMLTALKALHDAGLDPVPHVAVRRIESRDALETFLRRAVRECGVHRVLLLGGDAPASAGPYDDALSALQSGLVAGAGVREVAFAGYPEGHPRIEAATLDHVLVQKAAAARAQSLGVSVVTQFAFAPARIVAYCASLARTLPDVPVYVGLAGPANPVTLMRYAQRCGVAASLRALQNLGTGAVRLLGHTDPEELILATARYCGARPTCNVVGVHFFSFGGVEATAKWMNRMIAG